MRMAPVRPLLFLVALLAAAGSARGQNESKLGADFRGEGERFHKSCGSFSLAAIPSCAELLFTDHPLHVAVGSIAPENGFGAGGAFVAHATPNDSWRLTWDADAVGSINGSWRAGAYLKAIYTGSHPIPVRRGRPAHPQEPNPFYLTRPYFNLYAQAISLNKLDFFGLGPSTSRAARSFFGMRETIAGINATVPIPASSWLRLSLYGEMNGRFVALRPSAGQPSPSIERIYTEASAPGLATQPAFAQFGQGIRLQPAYGDRVRLDYFVSFEQYVAAGDSRFSFRRFTADLSHEFPIYSTTRSLAPRPQNGPDDCSLDPDNRSCPAITRNREGSFTARLLISESIAPAGHVVPFYLDPTLGGADINGNPSLPSYQDYRFRGPDLLLIQGRVEHSLYGPLGLTFGVEGGKVALTRGGIDFSNLDHSYSAGLTLRAGGFPQVFLLFAWGGSEGTHTIALMNPSLLGGAARPSLY
ncbi:MAG TPA: hypothetical protein VGS20_16100 [Candidatus Acidoferrales bacterium]|nr:hypothetical protein [Candidatus Acidoferrales bacterium]